MAQCFSKCPLSDSDEKLIHETAARIENILDRLVAVQSAGESSKLLSALANIAAAASTELKVNRPAGEPRPPLHELVGDVDDNEDHD